MNGHLIGRTTGPPAAFGDTGHVNAGHLRAHAIKIDGAGETHFTQANNESA